MDLKCEIVKPRWDACIIAAPGPSLDEEALRDAGLPILAVGDAYRFVPWAEAVYSCDDKWWLDQYDGTFKGELWSTHQDPGNDKTKSFNKWGMHLVAGDHGQVFSRDPALIRYGSNSGFQAINLAIHFGCKRIILVGYNMGGENKWRKDGRSQYTSFVNNFVNAAKHMPEGVRIINATPNSALNCFEKMELSEALSDEIYCSATG